MTHRRIDTDTVGAISYGTQWALFHPETLSWKLCNGEAF
jgi:hypothetical protein